MGRGLIGKGLLRLRRPLARMAGLEWRLVPKAWRIFARPLPYLARYLEMKAVRGPWRLETRAGLGITIKAGDDLLCAWDCFVAEEYPVEPQDRLIVDGGANIGAFSLYAAGKAPGARIVALEPVKATFAELEAHVRGNGLMGRVRCLRLGIAGATGTASLSVGGGSAYSSMYGPGGGPREEVRVLSLADLWAELGRPEEADLLKLDCEGAEMACLLAADAPTLRRFRRIALEYHLASGHAYAALAAHLARAGFAETAVRHAPEYGTGLAAFARTPGSDLSFPGP